MEFDRVQGQCPKIQWRNAWRRTWKMSWTMALYLAVLSGDENGVGFECQHVVRAATPITWPKLITPQAFRGF